MNEIRRPDSGSEDIRRVRDILDDQRLPRFVDGVDVRVGTDHLDHPSIWIIFHAVSDLPPDRETADSWVEEISASIDEIRDRIYTSDVVRFPYFRVEAGSSASKP